MSTRLSFAACFIIMIDCHFEGLPVVFSGPLAQWHLLRRWGLGIALGASIVVGFPAHGRPRLAEPPAIERSVMPPEARVLRERVDAGGPFRYEKDGAVFGNRERALPPRPRGFYREYTVTTPGARDRGARRIICGGHQPTQPVVCYYTADHYNSFRRITP